MSPKTTLVTDTGDTRSLTYAEIGKARGISAASAKRLALRHGWRKVAGNAGLARVSVPVTWLETSLETLLAISPATVEARVAGDMSPATVPVAWLIEARADAARKEGEAAGLRQALRRGDAVTEQALGQAERDRERADAADRARQAAEAREAEAIALARQVVSQLEAAQRERANAFEGEAVAVEDGQLAQQGAQEAAAEAAAARSATTRAAALAAEERAARQAAEAAAEAARGELTEWTAGGPLGRAWRALTYRGNRP